MTAPYTRYSQFGLPIQPSMRNWRFAMKIMATMAVLPLTRNCCEVDRHRRGNFRGSRRRRSRTTRQRLSGTNTALTFATPALALKCGHNRQSIARTGGSWRSELRHSLSSGPFYGSIDYWSFDFSDPIQLESVNQIVNAYDDNGCADGGTGVGTPVATSRARCSPGNIRRRGAAYSTLCYHRQISTSGLDYRMNPV